MNDLYLDCEFNEDGATIDLVSIALVGPRRDYYAVSAGFSWRRFRRNRWLMENVLPGLPRLHGDARMHYPRILIDKNDPAVKTRREIADGVASFILSHTDNDGPPRIWAWCGGFDYVALSWLWGPMIDKPAGIPHYLHEIEQEMRRLGVTDAELPKQLRGHHNALSDAYHNRNVHHYLLEREQQRSAS